MKKYHAHIYFTPTQKSQAQEILNRALLINGVFFTVWKMYEGKAGPHALPMIELHFTNSTHEKALSWIRQNVGELSVLVHEDTGDDFRDHTEGFLWIGKVLPIDFSFFHQVQTNPELALHP